MITPTGGAMQEAYKKSSSIRFTHISLGQETFHNDHSPYGKLCCTQPIPFNLSRLLHVIHLQAHRLLPRRSSTTTSHHTTYHTHPPELRTMHDNKPAVQDEMMSSIRHLRCAGHGSRRASIVPNSTHHPPSSPPSFPYSLPGVSN